MRKVLIWILPLFALAWSCAKDDAGTAERAKARLTLNILEEGPRLAARAADEKAVQDVNVFLYDVRGIARPQHFYVQGGVLADGEKVAAPTVSFTAEQLAKGVVIKKGKKIYHKVTL